MLRRNKSRTIHRRMENHRIATRESEEALARILRIRENCIDLRKITQITSSEKYHEQVVYRTKEPWDFPKIRFFLIKKITWGRMTIINRFCSRRNIAHSRKAISAQDDNLVRSEKFRSYRECPCKFQMSNPLPSPMSKKWDYPPLNPLLLGIE